MLVFVRVFGFIVFSFSLFRFPSLSAGSECLGGGPLTLHRIVCVGCVHWVFVLVVSCGGHLGSV